MMASFVGSRGYGSLYRPVLLIVFVCVLLFLLFTYNRTSSELQEAKDHGERLGRQQDVLKTQIRDLLDSRGRLETSLQKVQADRAKCMRDIDQLKKLYLSQMESMKETLKFRISSLETENSDLQSRAGSYEEKYNEVIAAKKRDHDDHVTNQRVCQESTQKMEKHNSELNTQMGDLQHNLDTYRLDRLRYESIRQNCSNELAMAKMRLGQLQEEVQRMSTKLKMMENVFSDNKSPQHVTVETETDHTSLSPANQPRDTLVKREQPPAVRKEEPPKNREDLMNALQHKMGRGKQLQNSEQLLYRALAKQGGDDQLHPQEKQPMGLQENLPVLNPEEQKKPLGNDIPSPGQQFKPHLGDAKSYDFLAELLSTNAPAAAVDSDHEKKTFEQDQRDEERRLFEMFQGDAEHAKKEEEEIVNEHQDIINDHQNNIDQHQEIVTEHHDNFNNQHPDIVNGHQRNFNIQHQDINTQQDAGHQGVNDIQEEVADDHDTVADEGDDDEEDVDYDDGGKDEGVDDDNVQYYDKEGGRGYNDNGDQYHLAKVNPNEDLI